MPAASAVMEPNKGDRDRGAEPRERRERTDQPGQDCREREDPAAHDGGEAEEDAGADPKGAAAIAEFGHDPWVLAALRRARKREAWERRRERAGRSLP